MSVLQIPTHFIARDGMTTPLNKMSGAVSNFTNKASIGLARVDRAVRKVTPGLGAMGKQVAQFASFALAAQVLRAAGSAILDFEDDLIGVGKTTDIVGQDLKNLGATIVSASNDLKTIKTGKLLELAEAAGQLGVKGSENIVRFASVLGKLEKASDIRGEEGAKSIARLLTITKEGVGIVDRFGATLVALGNASAASESEILSVASEVGRATAAYKLNTQEILAISAALKSLDVAPEAAGSAIGKVFRGIELATLSGGKKLGNFAKIMDLSTKQVKETFEKSPQKAFSLFIKGLGRISDEGGSLAKSLIDVGLSGERVSKGIIPLATNFALLNDKLMLANTAFDENAALNKEFAASQKSVKAGVASLVRSFENLFIKQATAGSGLEKLQTILFFVADNMETIGTVTAIAVGAFVALKTTLFAARTALFLYNVAQGFTAVTAGSTSLAIQGNIVAMNASIIATKAITAATWLWDAALAANPIGLVVAALIALVALTAVVVENYEEWGAALSFLTGAFAIVINLFQAFSRNWENIKDSFQTGGIVSGLLAIGATLLDAILFPLQQILSLIGGFTGIELFSGAAAGLEKFRGNVLDLNAGTADEPILTNPRLAQAQATSESIERSFSESKVGIDINDNTGGKVSIASNPDSIPVTITSTFPNSE